MKLQKAFKKAIKKGLQKDKWVYVINDDLRVLRIHTEHKTLEWFSSGKRNNKKVTLDDIAREDWVIVVTKYLTNCVWKRCG